MEVQAGLSDYSFVTKSQDSTLSATRLCCKQNKKKTDEMK